MSKLDGTFSNLLGWLVSHDRLDQEFLELHLVHIDEQDEKNRSDPRAFCAVLPDDGRVFYADALNYIPINFQVGVLLHEIGHHAINGFDSVDQEVDVDVWITKNVPEAGYEYKTCAYAYPVSKVILGEIYEGRSTRTALNLQWVAPEFLKKLLQYEG